MGGVHHSARRLANLRLENKNRYSYSIYYRGYDIQYILQYIIIFPHTRRHQTYRSGDLHGFIGTSAKAPGSLANAPAEVSALETPLVEHSAATSAVVERPGVEQRREHQGKSKPIDGPRPGGSWKTAGLG